MMILKGEDRHGYYFLGEQIKFPTSEDLYTSALKLNLETPNHEKTQKLGW